MAEEKDLVRVRALLARSASTEGEEGRTCAVLACKQIRELGLDVCLEGAASAPSGFSDIRQLRADLAAKDGAIASLSAIRTKLNNQLMAANAEIVKLSNDLSRLRGAAARTPSAPKAPASPKAPRSPRAPSSPKAPKAPKAPTGFNPFDDMSGTRKIVSKYPSRCRSCGDEIQLGDDIWWTPGEGVECDDCHG